MGLPIGRLICASNRNDVLTQFIGTGVYDMNRPFHTTSSPSMDILVSSNLERLLFELSGKNGNEVKGYMSALSAGGRYEISSTMKDELMRLFAGGRCFEEQTLETIAYSFNEKNYLMDPHTAVGYKVLGDYRSETKDDTKTVVVSTASPFKFCDSVLKALGRDYKGEGIGLLDELAKAAGTAIPAPLAELRGKAPRFTESVPLSGMKDSVLDFLKGE